MVTLTIRANEVLASCVLRCVLHSSAGEFGNKYKQAMTHGQTVPQVQL